MRAKSAALRKSANVKEMKGRIAEAKEARDNSNGGDVNISHTDILDALNAGTAVCRISSSVFRPITHTQCRGFWS